MPPLVSILVPSFNSEEFLAECLESALRQTHPRIEIIVVDDGSTDSSLQIARSFSSRGVRVIQQENQGQAGALNTALEASQGEYIQYLDADDLLHPDKIALQIDALRNETPSTIASGSWARFKNQTDAAVFTPERVWKTLTPVDWLVESWQGGGMMHVAAWLIPRMVVQSAGPWVRELRWAANLDSHFFTRALLASNRCIFCAEARSYYRSGHASMSSWKSRKSLEATLRVLIENGDSLLAAEDSPRTRAAQADNLQRFVFAVYPDGIDLLTEAENRIRQLGGSRLHPSAGPAQMALSRIVGWKLARRIHRWARKFF